jgi:phenylalanine-4-hydroxylase
VQSSRSRIPPHLRCYVVEQAYDAYGEVAQAVWRFVLLHLHGHLKHVAHPAYVEGLRATGLSVDRVPRIEHVDECLARFGWGAVCVDGFIPPRAFQEFQALGLLPIAAEIRTHKHLAYTPAPDIIHEAAGHAPILVDSEYAAFLRRIGAMGARAFTLPTDSIVYDAIYVLSELKESPEATLDQVNAAERRLRAATEGAAEVSEATLLSRLYWWTAEYGLIGTPRDYRLYGAGLLSSLAESHTCRRDDVHKLPLAAECMNAEYDITRPQPQLFVASSFRHLHDVLDVAEQSLAYSKGGVYALEQARNSGEVATVQLLDGLEVIGRVAQVLAGPSTAHFIGFRGRTALARDGALVSPPRGGTDAGYGLALGPLAGGGSLATASDRVRSAREPGARLHFELASGLYLSATLHDAGKTRGILTLRDLMVRAGDAPLFEHHGPIECAFADGVKTAFAGASVAAFHPETDFAETRVPRARQLPTDERQLEQLYERALDCWQRVHGRSVVPMFESIHEALERHFPDDWLLRWNLLECLVKIGDDGELKTKLERRLADLEAKFDHREPIATGLSSLRRRARDANG